MTGPLLIVLLLLAIVFIIVATARVKLHPFLALLAAAYGVGLLAGLPAADTIQALVEGFGGTIGAIGIVIAAGTIIGTILEKSGGTLVMANTVLRLVGQARSALAMSATGAIVSIPVFCDSGFVILSPLNRSLAARANKSLAVYAVALSMGLYTTHVFVPPTPGPIAAAGTLQADLGAVILWGLVVSVPVMLTTYLFAEWMGRRVQIEPDAGLETGDQPAQPTFERLPSALQAFTPILVPVLLIALRSIAELPARPFGEGGLATVLGFLGNPNTALLLGVLLAFFAAPRRDPEVYGDWVGAGLRSAGTIILITGAGGALGNILRATPIADYLGSTLAGWNLGIFLPFVIAAALKTAQGSSTVAIITTASIMAPLLPALGLAEGLSPVLVTLAIGAGSMTVSHANDSYFWVVSQFSGMSTTEAYRLQTLGSGVAGITGIVVVFVLSLVL